MTRVKDRINKIERFSAVIHAALAQDYDGPIGRQALIEAVRSLVGEIHEEVAWLSELPDDILSTWAPDGDERADAERFRKQKRKSVDRTVDTLSGGLR